MPEKNHFPDYLMQALRGRRGLDKQDASQDADIHQMAPAEAFREYVTWHLGYRSWADQFLSLQHDMGMLKKGTYNPDEY